MKTKLEYTVQFKFRTGIIDEFKVSAKDEVEALNIANKKRKEISEDTENWVVSDNLSIVILIK